MAGPLALLCVFSIIGGWFVLPLDTVFPEASGHHPSFMIEAISIGIPLLGVVLAWLVYLRRTLPVTGFTESPLGDALRGFWHRGWGIDTLYDWLLVKPFVGISNLLRAEWVDSFYHFLVAICVWLHRAFATLQSGRMRWYATSMALGLIILITIVGWAGQ